MFSKENPHEKLCMEGKQKSLYNRQRIQRGAYDGHTQERNYKNAAAVLWHKFLLAETVNDIILSEIKDRLYLQNVDEDWLMSPETSPRDTFMARVTDLAFGDVVEEAVTSLYENKEALLPYSDLTETKDPGRLYDLMMETVMEQLICQDGNTVKRIRTTNKSIFLPIRKTASLLPQQIIFLMNFSRPSPVTKKKTLSSTGKRGSSKNG